MKLLKCDKCGCELIVKTSLDSYNSCLLKSRSKEDTIYFLQHSHTFDLCDNCYEEVENMMLNYITHSTMKTLASFLNDIK